ncbi:MAG: AraC family transcriptional regulator [Gemmatimonadetes bacterium]|nr:AraC family transcriptional regulator [Gemmatimonadota bacterium]
MSSILVLTRDARLLARLRAAWGPTYRVVQRAEWDGVAAVLRSGTIDVLAFDTGRTAGVSAGPSLRWLRDTFPDMACVAVVDPWAGRLAFTMGRRGVDGLVVAGAEATHLDLRRAAQDALGRALARSIGRRLHGVVDPLLARCVSRAVEAAERPTNASLLAEPEGISVGSLRRRLRRNGAPSPGRILRWGRLLRAARALERDADSIDRVAFRYGYSSGAALGRAIRRDVGLPTTTLKKRGGLACALEAFLRRVGDSKAGPGDGSDGASSAESPRA